MSSLDMTVIKQFFSALDKAFKGEPSSFTVEVTNANGMGTLRVIVCDEMTYKVLTKGREVLLQ